jgi:hypothetical protein
MSASKDPPRLPDVVDEAGDTPGWVPWLGFVLLLLFMVYVGGTQVHAGKKAEPAAGDEAKAAEEAAPAAAPAAGEKAEEPKPAE